MDDESYVCTCLNQRCYWRVREDFCHHYTNDEHVFVPGTYQRCPRFHRELDGSVMYAKGMGHVYCFVTDASQNTSEIQLHNVLLVPSINQSVMASLLWFRDAIESGRIITQYEVRND